MCGVGRGRGRGLEVLTGECGVCSACLEDQFCSLHGVVFREDQKTSGETVQTRQDGPEGEWQWSALEQKVEFTPTHCTMSGLTWVPVHTGAFPNKACEH